MLVNFLCRDAFISDVEISMSSLGRSQKLGVPVHCKSRCQVNYICRGLDKLFGVPVEGTTSRVSPVDQTCRDIYKHKLYKMVKVERFEVEMVRELADEKHAERVIR